MKPFAYTARSESVPTGQRGQTVMVSLYECDNCLWRSGWNRTDESLRMAKLHQLKDCDSRLVPVVKVEASK
jgi:hypothetical protein